MKLFSRIFAISLMVFLIAACSTERKLATRYVSNAMKPSLLVLMPQNIIKENLKQSDSLDSLSMVTVNAVIINKLDDQQVLAIFEQTYRNELTNFGIRTYAETEMSEFMQQDTLAWIVQLAQAEFQEYTYIQVEKEGFLGNEYSTDFPLNAVNMAFWFEFNPLNASESERPEMLFADVDCTDQYSGGFVFDFESGELYYHLDLDTLDMDAFYAKLRYSARLLAGYTYDYFMNRAVDLQFPEASQYFRYDPYRKKLFGTTNDYFILLQ